MNPPLRLVVGAVLVAVSVATIVVAGPVSGQGAQSYVPPSLRSVNFASIPYTKGIVCGACHTDIYNAWRESVHAQAYQDPLFQASMQEAIEHSGEGITGICLTCHAPANMIVTAKPKNDLRIAEGVGCDFCHSVKGANLDQFGAFDLDATNTMHGPYADAESPKHETVYSEFMTTSGFCATCHEYQSRAGAPILTTFTEYAEGKYDQQLVECQDCHMPLVMGTTVEEHIKRTGRTEFVGFHALPGGRDLEQLRRALGLELVAVRPGSGSVTVRANIENRAAGHWLPTGMPSRELVVEFSTHWGDNADTRELVFGRRVYNGDDERLMSVARMILEGERVSIDTRLRPGQSRDVVQVLPAPQDAEVTLVVRAFYRSTEDPDAPVEDIHRIERAL
jgi:hypothetical protein